MARLPSNDAFSKLSGQLGRQLVIKQYGNKTVVTAYPDMSKIKPSKKQKQKRNLFKEAVAYAKNINSDPKLKQKYIKKVAPGQTVYHYAIREYLQKNK